MNEDIRKEKILCIKESLNDIDSLVDIMPYVIFSDSEKETEKTRTVSIKMLQKIIKERINFIRKELNEL